MRFTQFLSLIYIISSMTFSSCLTFTSDSEKENPKSKQPVKRNARQALVVFIDDQGEFPLAFKKNIQQQMANSTKGFVFVESSDEVKAWYQQEELNRARKYMTANSIFRTHIEWIKKHYTEGRSDEAYQLAKRFYKFYKPHLENSYVSSPDYPELMFWVAVATKGSGNETFKESSILYASLANKSQILKLEGLVEPEVLDAIYSVESAKVQMLIKKTKDCEVILNGKKVDDNRSQVVVRAGVENVVTAICKNGLYSKKFTTQSVKLIEVDAKFTMKFASKTNLVDLVNLKAMNSYWSVVQVYFNSSKRLLNIDGVNISSKKPFKSMVKTGVKVGQPVAELDKYFSTQIK